jgi:UMF1 family MFS transporter
VVCNFAGLCLGATQSSGRALVGLFSPPEKSGEFFGLWGFSVKMAGVFSTLTFAWLQTLVTLPVALLFCILLFVLGLIFGSKVDEFRGKQRKAIV